MNLILKIFYNPNEALKTIKDKKPLLLPSATILITFLIITLLYIQFVILPNKESILSERNLPEEAIERAMEFMGSPLFYILTIFSSIFGFFIQTLTLGFIFFLISTLFKGKGDFIAFFSSAIHIYAINLLGSIVAFPIALLTGNPNVKLNFSIFLLFLSEKNFFRIFLEQAGFFTLWATFLYGLALHHIGDIERKKGIFISFFLWFFYSLFVTIIKIIL
ncbi:MAG: YIP1 family protein [Candidatus Hydrothermales bacterium]